MVRGFFVGLKCFAQKENLNRMGWYVKLIYLERLLLGEYLYIMWKKDKYWTLTTESRSEVLPVDAVAKSGRGKKCFHEILFFG